MAAEVAVIVNPEDPPAGVLEPVLIRRIASAAAGPALLQRVRDVEVTAEGQIVALDAFARNLKVYDGEGRFQRVIGRAGRGPGELSDGVDRVLYRSPGELIVPDLVQGRLQRFDLSGADLGTIPLDLAREGAPLAMAVHPDGRLLEATRAVPGVTGPPGTDDPSVRLRARGPSGVEVLFTLSPETGGARPVKQPELLAPQPVWALTPGGEVVVGDPAVYRIRIMDERGRTRRVFQRPFRPRPIEREDRDRIHELFAGFLMRNGMPRADAVMITQMSTRIAPEYPAFTRILADREGRIWVQQAATAVELLERGLEEFSFERLGSRRWDVFDGEGSYRAAVELPPAFRVTRVLGDTLVGVSEPQTEAPAIELYRVEGLRTAEAEGAT